MKLIMENWNNYLQEEETLDEGLAKKLLTTLALIGGLAGSPDAQGAIQADPDTVAASEIPQVGGETWTPFTTESGLINDEGAAIVVGALNKLDPAQFPGAAEAAEIFGKAHKSGKIKKLENMPPVAQKALRATIYQLQQAYQRAQETGNIEDFGATVDNFTKMAGDHAGETKLAKKFRDK
jgi:hypothetical protein